jgi:hypothetical protein
MIQMTYPALSKGMIKGCAIERFFDVFSYPPDTLEYRVGLQTEELFNTHISNGYPIPVAPIP